MLSAPAPEEDKFENIDFDSILNNKRVLTSYINCLTDKGPCTPQGKELKRKDIFILLFYTFYDTKMCMAHCSVCTLYVIIQCVLLQ